MKYDYQMSNFKKLRSLNSVCISHTKTKLYNELYLIIKVIRRIKGAYYFN